MFLHKFVSVIFLAKGRNSSQVYNILCAALCIEVYCSAFMCFQLFGKSTFPKKYISAKAAHKMFVKLTFRYRFQQPLMFIFFLIAAFMSFQFVIVIFWWYKICVKSDRKMFVKLILGVDFINVLRAAFTRAENTIKSAVTFLSFGNYKSKSCM